MLPVSAPFHSSLLKPAAERLAQRLAQVAFAAPAIPVVHNVDVASHADARRDPRLRSRARRRARCAGARRSAAFAAQGVTHVVECGPGKVLAGLVRRIDDTLTAFALGDRLEFDEALAAALEADMSASELDGDDRAGHRRDARHRPGDRARRSRAKARRSSAPRRPQAAPRRSARISRQPARAAKASRST